MKVSLITALYCLVSVGFMFSCKERRLVKYDGNKQLLTMNFLKVNGDSLGDIRIMKASSDSVQKNAEFVAKIYTDRSDLQIVNAFIDCLPVAVPSVDTLTRTVIGCAKPLFVQNDTVYIGFTPTQPGANRFPEITILTLDDAKVYRTLQYSFDYRVY